MQRIVRMFRVVFPLMFTIVAFLPDPAVAGTVAGPALFSGSGTASPGLDLAPASQTYSITGTISGTVAGIDDANAAVPPGLMYTANCTFTGASLATESLAAGVSQLQGTCSGTTTAGGTVSISCTVGGGASVGITLIRVGAVAWFVADCDIYINVPGVITIHCRARVTGTAVFLASYPPAVVSFTLTAALTATCTVSIP